MLRPARPQRRGQDDDHRDPRRPAGRRCRRRRSAGPALGARRPRAARAARHPAPGNAAQREADRRGDRPAVPLVLPARRDIDEVLALRRARGQARRLVLEAVGRPEAAAGRGLRAGRRPGPAVSRRADHRPRPAVAPPALGAARSASAPGRHGPADDALHGRGADALRPRGDRRSRQGDRARHAAAS